MLSVSVSRSQDPDLTFNDVAKRGMKVLADSSKTLGKAADCQSTGKVSTTLGRIYSLIIVTYLPLGDAPQSYQYQYTILGAYYT